jgi:tRNA G18 (ribose-2'-O)-methylase SpoU
MEMDLLHDAGYVVAALGLTETAVLLADLTELAPTKLALILGNEGHGLKPRTLAASDLVVKIPMARGVDSLNVAAASAVAFYATQP